MPEFIGPIQIPEQTPSGTFPVKIEYGATRIIDPQVAVHAFASGDHLVEQRIFLGNGAKIIRSNLNLTSAEYSSLIAFYESRKGSLQPFTLGVDDRDGHWDYTVIFNQPLQFSRLADGTWNGAVELQEVPSGGPVYTVSGTHLRVPDGALNTALLSQVQTIIPLIKIVAGAYTIYLSDRRVTVGGTLYQARLISHSGISQEIGGAQDLASFILGNADRVFTELSKVVNLKRATVEFSLFHVGTTSKIDLWAGEISNWNGSTTDEFTINCDDGLPLRMAYPSRKIQRYKKDSGGSDVPEFFVPEQPVPAGGKKGISKITATSVIADTVYGKALKDIYVNNADKPFPVKCDVICGRDESEYYSALGVIGRGPISGFKDLTDLRFLPTLENQTNHGPGNLGLRRSYGGNPTTGSETLANNQPDAGSDSFTLDEVGVTPTPTPNLLGAAFLQIRRSDEKGIQAIRPDDKDMQVWITGGLGGWVWTAPGTRVWTATITNPFWVAVNTYLRAKGMQGDSAAAQETKFDVASAIACAAICNTTVAKIIGAGTETQFTFVGKIDEEKPLRDWLREILSCCLGEFYFNFGKLTFSIRVNASATEAFTDGNAILGALRLDSYVAEFNELTVGFADEDYQYQNHTVHLEDLDAIAAMGRLPANANIVGVSNKSQAARICTVSLREKLGGLTAAEQMAARMVSDKTTILALSVTLGMVVSRSHADAPGGVIKYRVRSWRLNSDYSIDLLGPSVTDSMYDLAIGPKPVDVTPDPVPEKTWYPIDLGGNPTIPPAPSIDTYTLVVGAYTNGQDGDRYARIDGTFVIPSGNDRICVYICEKATTPAYTEYVGNDEYFTGSFSFWYKRPKPGCKLWVMLVPANGATGAWGKPSATCPVKSVDIAAWGTPGAISGIDTDALKQQVNAGIKQFRYEFNFTAPAATDPDYYYTRILSAWVDITTGAWVPGVSKWEVVWGEVCNGVVKAYLGGGEWFTCIKPGVVAGRRRWRIRTIGWDERPTVASEPEDISDSFLTPIEPYTDGLDLAYTKESSLGKGMGKDALGRVSSGTTEDLFNGDFELLDETYYPMDWSTWHPDHRWVAINVAGTLPGGGGAYHGNSMKAVADGNEKTMIYNFPVIPGKTYRISAIVKDQLTPVPMNTFYIDAGSVAGTGALVGTSGAVSTSFGDFKKYEFTVTAFKHPTDENLSARYIYIRVALPPAFVAGYVIVDKVKIEDISSVESTSDAVAGLTHTFVGPEYDTNGMPTWRFFLQWTGESITERRAALRFEWIPTSPATSPIDLVSSVPIDAQAFDTRQIPYKTFPVTGTLRGWVLSKDGLRTQIYNATGIVIPAAPANSLNLGNSVLHSLPTAAFATTIEPVTLVSGANPLVKSTNSIFNTTDGKLYRWNGVAYARLLNGADVKAELALDKLTAGQISAGAIGTTELATVEILVGPGGGRCPRIRVNDLSLNMIVMMGDDGAGFQGLWAQTGRFGGTFLSPKIQANSTALTIVDAVITVNGTDIVGGFKTTIDNAKGLRVEQSANSANYTQVFGQEVRQYRSGVANNSEHSYNRMSVWDSSANSSRVDAYAQGSGIAWVTAGADNTVNAIRMVYASGTGTLVCGKAGASVNLTGSNSFLLADQIRWNQVFSNTIDLSTITINQWVPAYNAAGTYLGKIPIIP